MASIIDDAIIQTKNHLIKVGIQPEFIRITQHFPTNFNGTYVFGGDVTSIGATFTGIQQYVNALNGAANGSPTTFPNVTGNPDLEVFQFRNAVYYQDDWKALPNLHFAYGLRYYTQTDPTNGTGLQPRLSAAWSPDKKQTWNLHAHAGLFSGRNGAHNWVQIVFSDGTHRITNTLYNPTCSTTGVFNPGPVRHSTRRAPAHRSTPFVPCSRTCRTSYTPPTTAALPRPSPQDSASPPITASAGCGTASTRKI